MATVDTEALAKALLRAADVVAFGGPLYGWEDSPEPCRQLRRGIARILLTNFRIEPDARPLWTVACGRHEISGYPDGEVLKNVRGLTKGEALGQARRLLGVKDLPPGTVAEKQDGWVD